MQFDGVVDQFDDVLSIFHGFLWMSFLAIELKVFMDFIDNPLKVFAHCADIIATAHKIARDGGNAKRI